MTSLKAISNHKSVQTFDVLPWEYKVARPEFPDKAAFVKWCGDVSTKHCFFSGNVGVNEHQRVSSKNPVSTTLAIVGDYDGEFTLAQVDEYFAAIPDALCPNYACITFSGGVRLVYLLALPMHFGDNDLAKAFAKECAKRLKLLKWFDGTLDVQAIEDVAKTYEVGQQWQQLREDPAINGEAAFATLVAVSKKFRFDSEEPNIPIEEVEAKVHELYPGRWDGPFVEGARGKRFWNEDSDGPLNAEVRANGMVDYVSERRFWPWRVLFAQDAEWVNRFIRDRLGRVLLEHYYDGTKYWFLLEKNRLWLDCGVDSLRRRLAVLYGLDPSMNGGTSEVDQALVRIETEKRLSVVGPFVHQRPGIITFQGKPALNTAMDNHVRPATDKAPKWGEGFKWIANFLDRFFSDKLQQTHFLDYSKLLYKSAHDHRPMKHHVCFIAGAPGQGKTLLTTIIIGELLGGAVDASAYILGGNTFSGSYFDKAVWTMDDEQMIADARAKKKYSSFLKKMASNKLFEYNQKYQKSSSIAWAGALFVTCNKDVEALKILPELGNSNEEKINFYNAAVTTAEEKGFGGERSVESVIAEELEWFAAWLYYTPLSGKFKTDVRYGIEAYHYKELREEAEDSSESAMNVDIFQTWAKDFFSGSADEWQGSVTEFQSMLCSSGSKTENAAKKLSSFQLNNLISTLVKYEHARRLRINGNRVLVIKRPANLVKSSTEKKEKTRRKNSGNARKEELKRRKNRSFGRKK